MMRKNIWTLSLATMMILSLAVGCGRNGDTKTTAEGTMTVQTEPHGDEHVTEMETSAAQLPAEGKMAVNFEGRVTAIVDHTVTLDNGKTILIDDHTSISAPDGSAAEIAVGNYIQGYAENPDDNQIQALSILITAL